MPKKTKEEKFDGLSPKDISRIRAAIRSVWMWSTPRKIAGSRCIGEDGFLYCEKCKQRTPKIQIDHIIPVGDVDSGFIERLFCPSSGLRALCKPCHQAKTNEQRKAVKEKEKVLCQTEE